MKKLVMKLDLHDEKYKKKAMQVVSGISGVTSVTIDMKEKKMTVIGDVDAVKIASKLRKICHADLLTVGENKKEGDKKDGDNKKEAETKKETENKKDHWKEIEEAYRRHQYLYAPPPYYYHAVPEDDNSPNCVIC